MFAASSAGLTIYPIVASDWLLIEEGFNLLREHEVESLFAVGNGYVGVRGSLVEGSEQSMPATLLAGVFDLNPGPGSVPDLFAAPDWTRLRILVEGRELRLDSGELLEHRRMLDLRQGMLWREWRQRDESGRITLVRFLRFASLADRHVLFQSVMVTAENYSGVVAIESWLRQRPTSQGLEVEANVTPAEEWVANGSWSRPVNVVSRTRSTNIMLAIATTGKLSLEAGQRVEQVGETKEESLVQRSEWDAEIGQCARLDQLVSIYTSRETERPAEAAEKHLHGLLVAGVERLAQAHVDAWEARWRAADIEVAADADAQRALRFALYHLISAANPEQSGVSVGARALTGPAYKGHVFWDTEIYILPFYTFTDPATARALLLYRYHTLPAAREKARNLGYRGALYAWESAHTGEETTPPFVVAPDGEVIRILTGEQEHHISADVAYAVWQYWQATADEAFLLEAGAEIMLETARFWAGRSELEEDGRYHIRGVIGPDEYHESVDDNAYTNGMAQWNLERGVEAAQLLQTRWTDYWQELAARLGLSLEEVSTWEKLAADMYTGFDPETGLFEQFRGYFDLEEVDLTAYASRTVAMDVLLGREQTQRSQVIKQADVVLLLYLLWDRFSPQVREANFRYYEPRTGHGSSLSPAIHALMATRFGDIALAEQYFQQTAEIDLANNMGNAAGGVHIAALGGLWQAVVFGFAGLRVVPGRLMFDPHLPSEWEKLSFPFQWGTRRLQVELSATMVEVGLEGDDPLVVAVEAGPETVIRPGDRRQTRLSEGRWAPWEEVA